MRIGPEPTTDCFIIITKVKNEYNVILFQGIQILTRVLTDKNTHPKDIENMIDRTT